ncbi:MAG: transcriptional repressor [Gammaproteobacteria bacterium]|jgi:Fur family iron response transcriptional regulator|nr:transcriptional repressor [Gammaproteobacteria bacterium]MDH5241609.1 transcriptional repressor [Gammaproteobacteria bacterium]MDH5261279.1 transcriptional repressor [Gammaproteobacteria bacterium]MDH5583223.1 transcriptional repressor [Gammaproteobacteria bacterium]
MLRSEILARFDSLGILPTSQRLEIAAILLEKAQHLSVEQVLTRLRAKDSTVSKATVYNSLNLFGKKGLIKECLVDPERRYYDSTTSPHHHFFNSDTGELSDIASECIEVSGLPDLPKGTQLESAELIIRVRNVAD